MILYLSLFDYVNKAKHLLLAELPGGKNQPTTELILLG